MAESFKYWKSRLSEYGGRFSEEAEQLDRQCTEAQRQRYVANLLRDVAPEAFERRRQTVVDLKILKEEAEAKVRWTNRRLGQLEAVYRACCRMLDGDVACEKLESFLAESGLREVVGPQDRSIEDKAIGHAVCERYEM